MPAIVSNEFRIRNADNFKENIKDTANSTYIFVGKSDAWNPTLGVDVDLAADEPFDTISDLARAYTNMSALKIVGAADVINMVPRYNWTSGSVYVPWDSTDEDIYTKQYYVVTTELKVYKCILAGPGVSTEQPTQTNVLPTAEGDGYTWKYMYTLSAADAAKFLTNFYMPVKTVKLEAGQVIGDLPEADQIQLTNQNNSRTALEGGIYYIKVTSGGTGYTSAPTVVIDGNGAGATATASISGGAVVGITVNNAGGDYDIANVYLTGGGGTGATATAILSPGNGHGTDPVKELGATYIGLNVKFDGEEGDGDFVVNNDFRQIGILQNPFNFGTSTIATDTTLQALKSITFSSHSGFVVDDVIVGGTSGAVAYVDFYDVDLGILRYHQNNKTGFVSFQTGETITGNTSGTGVVDTLNNPEVQPYSGQVLFIENREPVSRAAQQIEDIKIVIEF